MPRFKYAPGKTAHKITCLNGASRMVYLMLGQIIGKYRLLQIVQGGELSRYAELDCNLLELNVSLVQLKPIAQVISLEFHDYRLIRENR